MYLTKSYNEVMAKRTDRAQALPGFPYISFGGAEALHMAYHFKVLLRDNLAEAVYRDETRLDKSTVDMANKTLRDLVAKDYLEKFTLGHSFGYMYSLGNLGYDYLGIPYEENEIGQKDLIEYYAVNRVFTVLCRELRENYYLEWQTGWKDHGAVCIVWSDKKRSKALKMYIIEHIRPRIDQSRFELIKDLQKKITTKTIEDYDLKPTLIVAVPEMENFMLEVDEDTTNNDIALWLET